MLNIVVNNERNRSGSAILGYITEVLHREYINVTNDPTEPPPPQLPQQGLKLPIIDTITPSIETQFTSNTTTNTTVPTMTIPATTATTTTTTVAPIVQQQQTPSNTISAAQLIPTNSIRHVSSSSNLVMANNKPPQVIKLQPFVSPANSSNQAQIQSQSTTNKVNYMFIKKEILKIYFI